MRCPYASIFLTALDKNATLADAEERAALRRGPQLQHAASSTSPSTAKVLDNGKAPILLEPVKATIAIAGRTIAAVNVLDHDGRRTDKTLPVKDGQFAIDGARDQTLYYEVVFQ